MKGIYTVVDGVVTMIADTNTRIPNTPAFNDFTDFSNPWISNGNVVFRGIGPGIEGIYTNLGGSLRRVASTAIVGIVGNQVPDGVGEFTGFGGFLTGPAQAPSIGGDAIAFYGEGSGGQQGIYAEMEQGILIRIADTNTAIPGGGGAMFPGFDVNGALSAATYDGEVVFVAGLDSDPFPNRLGIYKWSSGSLTTIIDDTTVVPPGGGNLTSFGEAQGLSFYNDEYSFLGEGSAIGGGNPSPQGIYAVLDGQLIKVLKNGDLLEGETVGSMGSYGQGVEDGSFVFNIGSWGNVAANVVAIQEHRWLGAGSTVYGEAGSGADWEDKTNWPFGGLPRAVVPTIIAPDGAATIHGPVADTQLASLQLGGGAGVATLWLFNGALITTPSTTIESKGVLAGEGRLSGAVTNHGVIRPDDISTGAIQNNGLIDLATAASRLSTGFWPITNNGTVIVEGLLNPGNFLNNGIARVDGTLAANGCVDNNNGAEFVLVGGNALITGDEFHNRGVLRGSGRIKVSVFDNNSVGEIRVGAGDRMVIDNNSDGTNSGVMEVIDGELEFKQTVTNFNTSALILARDATLRFGGGGLINRGAMAVSFGTTDIFGDIDNRPTGSVPAGTIVLSGNSNTTFYGDVINDGSFQVSTGSTAVFFGDFTGANGTTGGGDVFMEGDLRPGNSPAQVTFGGNLSFGGAAGLSVELGGLLAGDDFDQVVIAGDAALAGVLDVSLIAPFTLDIGQMFEIIDIAGARSGTFNGLAEGALVAQLSGVDLFITYAGGDGNDVVLFTPGLSGDFNNDGLVDAADYTVWRDHLGAPAGALPNDVDGGVIGPAQYATWKANFGMSLPAAASLEQATVPEPAANVLMILFLAIAAFATPIARSSGA